jgi:GNAT superfamily N-acetyltransferase
VSSDFVIRRAQAADRKTLLNLWLKLDQHLPETLFGSAERGKKKLHQRLARQLTTVDFGFALIAWCDNQPAGCVAAHLFDKPESTRTPVGILYNLWVEADFRRRGLASQLADQAEAMLFDLGAKSLQVAWRVTGPGQQFWEGRGFASYEVMAAKLPPEP